MSAARLTIGRVLRVLGIALLVTGVGVSVGQAFGLLPRLPFVGLVAILVSTPKFPGQPVGSQGPFQWPGVRRGVHSGSLAPLQPDIFHCHNSSRTSKAS